MPEGIFVGYDDVDEELVVSVEEEKRNEETLAYLKDIKIIEINGETYSNADETPSGYYTFSLDESEYTVTFKHLNSSLKVNEVKILTKSYKDYSVNVENPYCEPYGDMF